MIAIGSDANEPVDVEVTGYVRQKEQESSLRELGYIVLGRNGKNQVRALALHPGDPRLKATNNGGGLATLNVD